jgi:hypothetical protein
MQITIVEADIKTAIQRFILDQFTVREGKTFEIELSATRGVDGFKATIDIVDIQPEPETPPARRGRPPAAAKTEVQQASENVGETVAPVVEVEPVKVKTSGTRPLGIAAKAAEAKAEVQPVPGVTEETPVEETPVEEVAETPATEEVEAEAVADTAPVEEAPAEEPAPRASLFSGLKKTN